MVETHRLQLQTFSIPMVVRIQLRTDPQCKHFESRGLTTAQKGQPENGPNRKTPATRGSLRRQGRDHMGQHVHPNLRSVFASSQKSMITFSFAQSLKLP